MKKQKIILDLCGGSGSWSRPYKEAGYDVRLITLPDYDVRTYTPPDHVYGILAAPPCTEFSVLNCKAEARPRNPGCWIIHCHGMFAHHCDVPAQMVGTRKSRWSFAGTHAYANDHIPAVGVWRSVDETNHDMGTV